jgi:hypothetical protein
VVIQHIAPGIVTDGGIHQAIPRRCRQKDKQAVLRKQLVVKLCEVKK